ncbi:hypothetical protein [Sphingomonas sp. RB1R13]|uniref:hypothetical protein n=1 Tax=Sphingomonas sp. RB1R13 TaxID=3096159 RepID=UPI002FC88705
MLLAASAPAIGADRFVPDPHAAFDGFAAIRSPRPDVPVGALWVQGYGPTGEGATADNLETVRSLNGINIDKNLQLSLSTGLFSLLGIDPHVRDHFTAHFTELTIIRVKDVSKLSGPPGEPRIVAALKAGGVTVTSDGDVGLNARTIVYGQTKIQGSTTNDRTRTFSIDGRDLFIAIRVATMKAVESKPRELALEAQGERSGSVTIDGDRLLLTNLGCEVLVSSACSEPPMVALSRAGQGPVTVGQAMPFAANGQATVMLAMPQSDGGEGLYTQLRVKFTAACERSKREGCRHKDQVTLVYIGELSETLAELSARAW